MQKKIFKQPLKKLPPPYVPETVGRCPQCGENAYSGTYEYYCRSCDFLFSKKKLARLGKKSVSMEEMSQLLDGKVVVFSNLSRKDGRTFDGAGVLSHSDEHGWGVKFIDRGFTHFPYQEADSEISE